MSQHDPLECCKDTSLALFVLKGAVAVLVEKTTMERKRRTTTTNRAATRLRERDAVQVQTQSEVIRVEVANNVLYAWQSSAAF